MAPTETSEMMEIYELQFCVTRSSRRKTLEIGVDRQGELTLSAPASCTIKRLEKFARERKFWVYTKLAEKDRLLKPRPPKEFVEGEGFLYLGRSYRLKFVSNQIEPFKLLNGRLQILHGLEEDARNALVGWYSNRLKNL